MKRLTLLSLALLPVWSTALPLRAAFAQQGSSDAEQQEEPSAEEVVGVLEKLSGVHKGLRRNHAKGFCAAGTFQANSDGGALSVSPLLSGQKIPLIARFSVAGPNPEVSDAANGPRGMALQFQLPGGALHNMAVLNIPVFGASSVQSFLEGLQANLPDPATGKPDPETQKAFFAGHPDAKPLVAWLATHNPPPSYAQSSYSSLHAFKFIAADKREHWVKWRFEPRDGVKSLSDAEMTAAPKDFLAARFAERLKQGPVVWDMIVTLGEPGDPLDNPSLAWPATRKEVKAGALSLDASGGDACDEINFDPNLVSTGIEPSPDDKILAFRSLAYGVSVGRRLEEKHP